MVWYAITSRMVWNGTIWYCVLSAPVWRSESRSCVPAPWCQAERGAASQDPGQGGLGEPPLVWPSTGRQKGRSVPSEDGSLWVLSSCHCSMNSSGDCSLSFPPCPFCSSLCSYPGHSSSFHLPSSAPPPSPDSSSPLPSPGVRIPGSST